MSLQLIYTSAQRLLEPGMTGYGVVARSEKMPVPLAKRIAKLSNYKDFHRIKGAQYSYRIIDCAAKTYHVLSCIQEAGSDYSGRNCHIAHHLAFDKELVSNLRQHSARPTPAGLMLALQQAGFWLKSWQGEPTKNLPPAPLAPEDMPEVNSQRMWKRVTGHKSNAKSFSTPPYEHDCLVMVPQELDSSCILQLLNESDWLDRSHGWGKTFTTHGESNDTFADTQRIFVADGDALESRAKRTGRPILRIHPKFVLAEPSLLEQAPIMGQHANPTKASDNPEPPYSPIPSPPEPKPIEPQEESMPAAKALPLRKRKRKAWVLPTAVLLLLTGITAFMIQSSSLNNEEDSEAQAEELAHMRLRHQVQQSRERHGQKPHPRSPQGQGQGQSQAGPPTAGTPHSPANPRQQGTPPSRATGSGKALGPPSTPPSTAGPRAGSAEAGNTSPPSPSSPVGLDALEATLVGDAMPIPLQNLLKSTPVLLESGGIQAGCLDGKTVGMKLSKGSHGVLIESISDDQYRLTPVRAGVKNPNEQLILKAGSHFQGFTLNDQEAYLLLIINNKRKQHKFLLLPRYTQKIQLPAASAPEELSIKLEAKDIVTLPEDEGISMGRLTLSDSFLDNCPHIQIITSDEADGTSIPTLAIPQIKAFGTNNCQQSATEGRINELYTWECQETASGTHNISTFQHRIAQRNNIKSLMLINFNILCNKPITSSSTAPDSFYSIATLYHLLQGMDAARTTTDTTPIALAGRYCKLYTHPEFAALLSQIFGQNSAWTLTPTEAAMQTEACVAKRQAILEQLSDPAVRSQMLDCVRAYLSQELQARLTEAIKASQDKGEEHEIELIKAYSVKGQAIWTFQIK